MANFDTSNLVVAQQMLADKYAAPEMRMKPAPAFNLLTNNAPLLMQEIELLRTREDRAVEAHLLARTKRAPVAGRTHNHTGTIDDSAKITLQWSSMADPTTISLKLLDKSVLDFNKVLANKLEQCCLNIIEAKETEAIAYLRANRATQQPAALEGVTFNAATDAIEVDAVEVQQNRFFAWIRSIARQNYFAAGGIDVIASSKMVVLAEFLMAQKDANATNWGYQFQNLNIVESTELRDPNYVNGSTLIMPGAGACALNWIPKQNRDGVGDFYSEVGGFGQFSFGGYQFALHGYAQRADTSATNGNPQDVVLQFELSLDTSYNKAPLIYTTDRTDSVIMEVAQAS
jgi:hypothetical protein